MVYFVQKVSSIAVSFSMSFIDVFADFGEITLKNSFLGFEHIFVSVNTLRKLFGKKMWGMF